MWIKAFLLCSLSTISIINAEAPLSKAGPYAPSGWRPSKPFNLPGEVDLEQPNTQDVKVDITQENIEFAGQIPSSSFASTNEPQNAYLSPDYTEFLTVQNLPNENSKPQFVQQRPNPGKNLQQIRPTFRVEQKPSTQFGQRVQSQNKPNFQQQQQQFRKPQQQQQQFNKPNNSQFFNSNASATFQNRPAQQYGAPPSSDFNNRPQLNIDYPDPRSNTNAESQPSNESTEDFNRTPIEALNAAIDAYNRNILQRRRLQSVNTASNSPSTVFNGNVVDQADFVEQSKNSDAAQPARFTQGQYYILSPDNSLQRVMFITSQNDEELENKGFTAQLKYMPVGEIRDPVFKYNNEGQLERIVK